MIKLTQRQNEININSQIKIKSIQFDYNGSFVAEVLGNCDVEINYNNIVINYLEKPPEVIIVYEGDLKIKNILAYDDNNNATKVTYNFKSDEWRNVSADYSNNTTKWRDYTDTFFYARPVKTLISYTKNNYKKYKNAKGQFLTDLERMENKKLNRIRGKYGIK